MKSILLLVMISIIAWLINGIFVYIQIKDFDKNYIEMRKNGKLVVGRRVGKLSSGAIVLIGLDDDGIINETRKVQGISIFARVKMFDGLINKQIKSITLDDLGHYNRFLQIAIMDAVKNYTEFKKI